MNKYIKYEDKFFKLVEKYERMFNKFRSVFEVVIMATIKVLEFVIFTIAKILDTVSKIIRYSTFPFHWLWIKYDIWKYNKNNVKLTDLPLFKMGAHYIYGLPKAGKTTVTFHAMHDYMRFTGKSSYTTEQFQTPKIDEFGREYFNFQIWSLEDSFVGGEQEFAFDTSKFNLIVVEEMLSKMHQRNNNKKSHNDVVIPLIASLGGQRHQGIDLFYFISQLPGNDIAIMQMLAGYHKVKIVKRFDYRNWLKTGKYKWGIKGWKMESSEVMPVGRSDYKLVNTKKWFYENKYPEEFKYYNKFNLAYKYKDMKVLQQKEMIA